MLIESWLAVILLSVPSSALVRDRVYLRTTPLGNSGSVHRMTAWVEEISWRVTFLGAVGAGCQHACMNVENTVKYLSQCSYVVNGY